MKNGGKILATILVLVIWFVLSILCSAAGAGVVIIIPLLLGMIYGIKVIWKKDKKSSNGHRSQCNDVAKNEASDDSAILQK